MIKEIQALEPPADFDGVGAVTDEERELAIGIDKDLAALKARLDKVKEAMKWAVHARHTHRNIGVLADEVERMRTLLIQTRVRAINTPKVRT